MEKNFGSKNYRSTKNWVQKKFRPKDFWVKQNVWAKRCVVQKSGVQKLGPPKICVPKILVKMRALIAEILLIWTNVLVCCLEKCHLESWHILKIVPGTKLDQ